MIVSAGFIGGVGAIAPGPPGQGGPLASLELASVDCLTVTYRVHSHIIIIIIILESAVQGRERVRTLYQSKDTNPWKQEKDKTVGDKKERADHDNRKALALLLKPASPTPSNTGSLRSFQRGTERGTKLLRY